MSDKKKYIDTEDLILFRELLDEDIEAKIKENIRVVNAQTHYDFPSVGEVDTIYKAEAEKMVYQWNSQSLKYELLNSGEFLSVKTINGGNAFTK